MIYSFSELLIKHQKEAGGKASILARFYQMGYPVPNGFVILPNAFDNDDLKPLMWDYIIKNTTMLRENNNISFAVRSSALCEDSTQASFSGEFETILNVSTDEDIKSAILTVRKSRKSKRALLYSKEKSQAIDEMAVIIQVMVNSNISGILFTADPLTGSRSHLIGNFSFGTCDKLVSGQSNGESFQISRLQAKYDGPKSLQKYANQLYELAKQLEKELGYPLDIEWAISREKLYLLQARPITSLQYHDTASGMWNDSLRGDYLWTSTNWGEAVPDIMTPFTWSILQWTAEITAYKLPGGHPSNGNIGGRFYFNASLFLSMASSLGINKNILLDYAREIFGQLPNNINIPIIPFSIWEVVSTYGVSLFQELLIFRKTRKEIPLFISYGCKKATELRAQINSITSNDQLIKYWSSTIKPYAQQINRMMDLVFIEMFFAPAKLRRDLTNLVGTTRVGAFLSGGSNGTGNLASLELLISLSKVATGEMRREEYIEQYGHRTHHEVEMSIQRPAEDIDWIDKQISEFQISNVNIEAMLSRQREQHKNAQRTLLDVSPHVAKVLQKRIEKDFKRAQVRESIRSEWSRMFWVIRAYAIRVGELTGLGNDVFFLTIQEMHDILNDNKTAIGYIPGRRKLHAKYCALPPYPAIINGRFDPFAWAKAPNRRNDIFDSHETFLPLTKHDIKGFGGAPGIALGRVRILTNPEDAIQLQDGEILVTRLANIGWTILFTRAVGVITDVGAPLSHAAIVAQELGIPMIVGCGNATIQLKTGDYVKVNGALGTVEILPTPQ